MITKSLHDATLVLNDTQWLFIEGFEIGQGGGYSNGCFGFKQLGEYDIETLYHEVAHTIEFFITQPDRLKYHRMDFFYRKNDDYGEIFDEPLTCDGVLRELRTIAIQAHLQKTNKQLPQGVDDILNRWVSATRHLCDFLNVPANGSGSWNDNVESRLKWMSSYCKLYYDTYTPEQLISLWPLALNKLLNTKQP